MLYSPMISPWSFREPMLLDCDLHKCFSGFFFFSSPLRWGLNWSDCLACNLSPDLGPLRCTQYLYDAIALLTLWKSIGKMPLLPADDDILQQQQQLPGPTVLAKIQLFLEKPSQLTYPHTHFSNLVCQLPITPVIIFHFHC